VGEKENQTKRKTKRLPQENILLRSHQGTNEPMNQCAQFSL
jgi:hypothetical protein